MVEKRGVDRKKGRHSISGNEYYSLNSRTDYRQAVYNTMICVGKRSQ